MTATPSELTKERLFDEFNAVVAETELLLRSVASAGGDKAGAFKANVEQGLAAAGERLAKIRAESLSQAGAAATATDEYVRHNPWQAIGIVAAAAAFAGLAAGLIAKRR